MTLINEDRFGLGRDEFVREKQEKEEELKEKRLFDFRRHCLSQSAQRKLRSDLKKSRQACEHLDTANVSNSFFSDTDFSLFSQIFLNHSQSLDYTKAFEIAKAIN